MTTRFLCIDPRWDGGRPPDLLLTRTLYTGVRFVVQPDMWDWVGHYLELGLDVALVIARESGNPSQYTDWATADWMLARVHWFIGNEMDNVGESSWTMTPSEYQDLWHACKGLHGQRWVGGMATGQVALARPYLQSDAAGLAVHIYTLDPSSARAKVREYQAMLGVKVWVGETHPAGSYKLADYTWPSGVNVNDFAYSEAQVQGMGLYT